jgi:hypothetical protein
MRRWVVAWLALLVGGLSAAWAQDNTAPVPFVGCPSDGQQGPMAPPESGKPPSLAAPLADRLAWYKGNDLAVLAPRGWHCLELDGSSGSILLVTPDRHSADDLFNGSGLDGAFVIASLDFGSTSGRFAVARIAAPLFPVAREFVDGVLHEPETDTKPASIANDRLTRHSDTIVAFVTRPDKDGLGTDNWVRKSSLPISGLAMLLPDEDMDLVMVRVRLPPGLAQLASAILDQKRQAVAACRCASPD